MEDDSILLSIYMRGFEDCPDENDNSMDYPNKSLERKAYDLGWNHYIIGDDVTSIDEISDEEILKLIRR